MIITDKKNIMLAFLLIAIVAFLLYSYFIHNDRTGADAVRDHINAVGDKQQSAINRLAGIESGLNTSISTTTNIARGIEEAQSSIRNVQDRITASEDRIGHSAGLIGQGKSILDGVRKRGQGEN